MAEGGSRGSITTASAPATHFEGRRVNSPNDVVVKSDGSIWFSDPTYGIDGYYEGALAPSEIGAALLFRLDPACGELTAVARDRVRPNGLAFSPDESILYVADTGETHVADTPRAIHAYAVVEGGRSLSYSKTFAVCDNGFFDGFRVDIHGNLWTSSADSVRAHAPDGALIGRVRAPAIVSNLCFGGPRRNRLYITAQTSLYAIYLNTHAANWIAA